MKDYDMYDDQTSTEGSMDVQKEEVKQMHYEQISQPDPEIGDTPIETQQPQASTSSFIEPLRSIQEEPAFMTQEQKEEQIVTDTPLHAQSQMRKQDISPSSQEEFMITQKKETCERKATHPIHGEATTQVQKEQIPKRKKTTAKNKASTSFIHRHKNICLLSACLLLSLAGGFGGAMMFNQLRGDKTVLYQATTAKGTNTSSVAGTTMSVKEVAEKTGNSVVAIKTESMSTNSFFQQAVQSGAGSGVILSKDGYVVTNNHVIAGANKVSVTTKDGKSYSAKLIGTDPATDLAIIKITATNLSPAVFGESSKLEVGDPAIAIGNPLGELGGTVTNGIISALDREITIENQTMNLLQTSAAINPGNSGGGLFNDQGQLIGIVNAKSSGSNIEGLGFAIPIDHAKTIIANLIEYGAVKDRAALGVTLKESTSNTQGIPNRVFIVGLETGKAAEQAGLKVNDQILKIKDKEVTSISDVKTAINSYKAGDKIDLTVLRNYETKTISVTLGVATPATENNQQQEQQRNPFQGN